MQPVVRCIEPYGGHCRVNPQSISAAGMDGKVITCFPGPFGRCLVMIDSVDRCFRIAVS